MFRTLAVCTVALSAALGLPGQATAAGYCDNLEGQDVIVAGPVYKVSPVGVVFFTDMKTGCEFGLVASLSDPCKAGGQIEVKGKLRKNTYVKGIYDIERNRRAPDSLICR